MSKIKSKKPKKTTPDKLKKWKKQTGACHHNRVGYTALQKLALGMFKRSKQDAENIRELSEVLYSQKKIIDENKKGIATLIDKYEDHIKDLEKQLQECNFKRGEVTRAYNGLHTLGKFAEEQGIDIKNAKEDLPESEKNKYNFSQKHTVLESGKVKHEFFLKPKKNGKEPK